MRFSDSSIFNGLQPSKMAMRPCIAEAVAFCDTLPEGEGDACCRRKSRSDFSPTEQGSGILPDHVPVRNPRVVENFAFGHEARFLVEWHGLHLGCEHQIQETAFLSFVHERPQQC